GPAGTGTARRDRQRPPRRSISGAARTRRGNSRYARSVRRSRSTRAEERRGDFPAACRWGAPAVPFHLRPAWCPLPCEPFYSRIQFNDTKAGCVFGLIRLLRVRFTSPQRGEVGLRL